VKKEYTTAEFDENIQKMPVLFVRIKKNRYLCTDFVINQHMYE